MKEIKSILSFFAVAGNILFILWILYNGINEGFAGTTMQKIIYFSMMSLLAINTFLILGKNK